MNKDQKDKVIELLAVLSYLYQQNKDKTFIAIPRDKLDKADKLYREMLLDYERQ